MDIVGLQVALLGHFEDEICPLDWPDNMKIM